MLHVEFIKERNRINFSVKLENPHAYYNSKSHGVTWCAKYWQQQWLHSHHWMGYDEQTQVFPIVHAELILSKVHAISFHSYKDSYPDPETLWSLQRDLWCIPEDSETWRYGKMLHQLLNLEMSYVPRKPFINQKFPNWIIFSHTLPLYKPTYVPTTKDYVPVLL